MIVSLSLLLLSSPIFCQFTITKANLPDSAKHYTLLVEKFVQLDINADHFNNASIPKKETQQFIKKFNKHLTKHNNKLDQLLKKHFNFDYKLVNPSSLSNYDSMRYPFILKRDLIKILNGKTSTAGHFSFTNYIENRKDNKRYKDIDIFYKSYWKSLKLAIIVLDAYLE